MNTPNDLSENKSSLKLIQKKEVSDNLAEVLSVQWDENSLDLAYLNQNHPSFVKYNFSSSDLEYLEKVKTQLIADASLNGLQKVIAELPSDRTDLAEVITVTLFWRVQRANNENSLDLAYLNQNHPSFVKYNFSSSDLEYLEKVKTQLIADASLNGLQKVIAELPSDRTDLAEVITVTLFWRVQRANVKK